MIITIAIGVMLGVLVAGVISMCVITNKHFLGWYTKKISKMATDMIKEQIDCLE